MSEHKQQAQLALQQLQATVHAVLAANPNGLRVANVALLLGIESEIQGTHQNWFARSLLDGLVASGRAVSSKQGAARVYHAL
jgi:hypothetical protein